MADRATFLTDDFLLESDAAVRLYHDYAAAMPIVDYHCHLPPQQIAVDHRFANLTQIWLYGDHYKWRAMRAAGVPERYCTGDATDREKFQKWAETVPATLRNPLYHWTHLELRRPFGVTDLLLGPDTAQEIWDRCNAKLALPEFSCRGIMRQMNVVLVCTTDDPADDLSAHVAIRADASFAIQVLPTFRADRALAVETPDAFAAWLERLGAAAELPIRRYDDMLEALARRHEAFHKAGCRLSDHGLDTMYADDYTEADVRAVFDAALQRRVADTAAVRKYKSAVLNELAVLDAARGWTQQFHLGAQRNNNSRQFAALGPDTGFDSIGDLPVAQPLARFLDRLDREGRLAKTILYHLNPAANDVIATMLGNFQDGLTQGKIQFGSGWWFLDQRDGMLRQLESLSNQGLLSRFVGMLTDSRSFLSYTRHEYFRRILCNLLGDEIRRGLLPQDFNLVGGLVQDVCYNNAATYFGFEGLSVRSARIA